MNSKEIILDKINTLLNVYPMMTTTNLRLKTKGLIVQYIHRLLEVSND